MELGGGEAINLIGWGNRVNEKSSGRTFPNQSTHIKEPRCHELNFGAATSEFVVSSPSKPAVSNCFIMVDHSKEEGASSC